MQNFADRLVDLLDAPVRQAPYSWHAVEEAIGQPLPDDYKELIDRIGAVVVDEWLCLFGPDRSSRSSDIAALVDERERAWATFRGSGIELPGRYFANGGRLLAFAAVEANYFYWHAQDGVPAKDWGVVIVDADLEDWYEFDISATECLYKVLVGELQLEPFDDLFGGPMHRVEPF
jgi:hypothetical protein